MYALSADNTILNGVRFITYKYLEVRREVYNQCSSKAPKRVRSYSDIKKLFKKSFWALLSILIVACVAFVLLVVLFPQHPYYLIPVPVALLIPIVLEFRCEKIYNSEERNHELAEIRGAYEHYIQEIKVVFNSCGINSPQKRAVLKEECKASLEGQTKSHNAIVSNVYSICVGVPLGAIVSAIIYSHNNDIEVTPMIAMIMLGLIIIGFCKLHKIFMYYSEGYFKDRYLLNILDELEYAED